MDVWVCVHCSPPRTVAACGRRCDAGHTCANGGRSSRELLARSSSYTPRPVHTYIRMHKLQNVVYLLGDMKDKATARQGQEGNPATLDPTATPLSGRGLSMENRFLPRSLGSPEHAAATGLRFDYCS